MEHQRFVGVAEAAELIGVHPNTVRKWADQGLIPHMRLPSGYRRFRVEDVKTFQRKLEVGDGTEGKATARVSLAAA